MQTRARKYRKSPKTIESPDGMVEDHSQRRVSNWLLRKEDQEVQLKESPLHEPPPKQEALLDSDEMSKTLISSHISYRPPSEKDIKVQPKESPLHESPRKQDPPQDSDAGSDIALNSLGVPRRSDFSRRTGEAILRLINEISHLQRAPSVSLGTGIESVLKTFKALKEDQLGLAACLAECIESKYKKIAITSVSEFYPEALQLITYSSQDRIRTTSSYLDDKLNRYDLSALLDVSHGKLEEQILRGSLEKQIRYLKSEFLVVFEEFNRSVKLMERNIEYDFNLLMSCQNRFENFILFAKFSQKRQERIDEWIMKHHPREKSKRKSEKRKKEKAEMENRENEQKERIATIGARVLPGRFSTLSLFLIFSLVCSFMNYYIYSLDDGLSAELHSE